MSDDKKMREQNTGGDVESIIKQLMGIESMFQDFIDAESEGMIICENCYDTAFDDDEDIRTFEDAEGVEHIFCCEECMEEWKKQEQKADA